MSRRRLNPFSSTSTSSLHSQHEPPRGSLPPPYTPSDSQFPSSARAGNVSPTSSYRRFQRVRGWSASQTSSSSLSSPHPDTVFDDTESLYPDTVSLGTTSVEDTTRYGNYKANSYRIPSMMSLSSLLPSIHRGWGHSFDESCIFRRFASWTHPRRACHTSSHGVVS